MKFSDEKKRAIENYILDKIESGDPDLSQTVSAAFDINRNTVHRYINKLADDGIIERKKRGEYVLKKRNTCIVFAVPTMSLRMILMCLTNA